MGRKEDAKQIQANLKNEFETNNEFFSELAEKLLNVDLLDFENIDSIDLSVDLNFEFNKYINVCISQPRSCEILKKRLGMINIDKNTLEAIGEQYSISRERVRQIVEKCHKKLFASNYKNRGVFLGFVRDFVEDIDEKVLLHSLFFDLFELYGVNYFKAITTCLFDRDYSKKIMDKYNQYLIIMKQKQIEYIKEQKQQQRRLDEAKSLQRKILFPKNIRRFKASIKNKPFVRNINDEYEGTGYVYLKKANKEVPYESNLQYKVLLYLDNNDYVSEINTQCIEIKYEINGEIRMCYPNIVIKTIDEEVCIIEVKSLYSMALYNNILRFRIIHKYCQKYGLGYTIIDDRLKTIFDLKECKYNKKLANNILDFYNNYGKLDYVQYNELCRESNINIGMTELASLVLNSHFKWWLKPFSISAEDDCESTLFVIDDKKQN